MPKPERSVTLSRRQVLAGLGLAGAGMTVCAGGAFAGLLALAARRETSPSPTPQPTSSPTPGIARPAIVPRADWGALPPDHTAINEEGFYSEENLEGWRVYSDALEDVYNTVVVHHSVLSAGEDVPTLLAVQRLHREDRRWADVAYHFFVGRQGTLYEGRDLGVRGTHVAGYNTGTVGVCLLGNYQDIVVNEAQLRGAQTLINWLTYRLDLSHLAGHRDFNPQTQCPGDNLALHLATLASGAGLLRGTEGYVPPIASTCDCHAGII